MLDRCCAQSDKFAYGTDELEISKNSWIYVSRYVQVKSVNIKDLLFRTDVACDWNISILL